MKEIAFIMRDGELKEKIETELWEKGYRVKPFSPEADVVERLAQENFDLIVLGQCDVDTECIDLEKEKKIHKIRGAYPDTPIVIVFDAKLLNMGMIDVFKYGLEDVVYIKDSNLVPLMNSVGRLMEDEYEKLSLEFKHIRTKSVMKIPADITAREAISIKKSVEEELKSGRNYFILDMSNIEKIGSIGIGVLIYIRERIMSKKAKLRLVIKSLQVKRFLERLNIDKYFDIYDDISELVALEEEEKIRVAVIDDAKFMRVLVSSTLEEEGFDTISYGDPVEALEALTTTEEVNIVLVDYEMPELNGLEFIRKFKPKERGIPAIMLTTETDVHLAVNCIRDGASDYLTKPFKKEELIAVLKKTDKDSRRTREQKRMFAELKIRESQLRRKNRMLSRLYNELEEELSMASEIQKKLMPQSFPEIKGYKFSVKYKPSQDIGGDFYDLIQLDENNCALAFADVSGHGIPAALLSTMFKVYLVTHSQHMHDTAELMELLNELVVESFPSDKFISLFYMVIDGEKDVINYCKAAQEPAILVKKNGDIIELGDESQVLGLFSKKDFPELLSFQQHTLKPEKGDKIFLYTDGINEAQNSSEEFYGIARLHKVLKNNCEYSAEKMLDMVYRDLKDFLEGLPMQDDLTLFAIEKVE